MLRHRFLLWLAALPLLAVQPLLASTVQVGTCKPHLKSFSTISDAVGSVSAGSTIEVCPGTYAEQVTIARQLTLEGVTVGTANQVLITVPTAGLLPNAVSMFGEAVAAQIFVQGADDVDITNIAVDGTGGDMGCTGNLWIAGIFYGSGSSGTVDRVRASGQVNGTCGVGIWAENGDSRTKWITIENSSVYNVDSSGIFAGSGGTPTLSVNVNNDVVNPIIGTAGIIAESVNGQIHDNDISNASVGVFDGAPAVSVSANTIMTTVYGMWLASGGSAVNNEVSSSSIGVLLAAPGATVQNNRVMSSAIAGVDMGCFSAKVSGNFVNDAAIGIAQARAGIGSNAFANTATTVTDGCATAAAASLAVKANSRVQANSAVQANSPQQWHTPATPLGTRTK